MCKKWSFQMLSNHRHSSTYWQIKRLSQGQILDLNKLIQWGLKWCGDGWINLFNVLIVNLTPFTNQYYRIQLGNKYIKFSCDGNNYLWSPNWSSSATQPCHHIQGNDENITSANFCVRFEHLAKRFNLFWGKLYCMWSPKRDDFGVNSLALLNMILDWK